MAMASIAIASLALARRSSRQQDQNNVRRLADPSLDDSQASEVEPSLHNGFPQRHDRHALPPSVEAKREQHNMSSGEGIDPTSTHPSHLALAAAAFNRRAAVDEVLVSSSNDSHDKDVYRDAPSFIGTCIEYEMQESDDDASGVPLFDSRVEAFGEVLYTQRRQKKRKASQRVSTTFESVVGFGRSVKRRVSSLWSNSGKGRKDSGWVSFNGGGAEKGTSSGSEVGFSAKNQEDKNPYRTGSWLVAAREAAHSRGTSAHWTPCTTDARSMEANWSSPMTRRSTTDESFQTARMQPLERQPARALRWGDAVIIGTSDGSQDTGTPSETRPIRATMMETGYTLAQHLHDAASRGRFDTNRIAQRFDGNQEYSGSHGSAGHTPNRPSFQDHRNQRNQRNQAAERLIGSEQGTNKTKSWSFFKNRRTSQQPSMSELGQRVTVLEQEQDRRRSTFGADFAQVAGVLGSSMQQAPVML